MSAKALVIDANILIRGVLGTRTRRILELYANRLPPSCPQRPSRKPRSIWPRSPPNAATNPEAALRLLRTLAALTEVLQDDTYMGHREEAVELLSKRDPEDWPVLAAALAIGCPIWSEDADFFGCGVAVWTSDRVERYLRR